MKKNEHKYQFTAMPVNLTACMDNNCRSMLFTLLQLSSFYAGDDGWFFRSNSDLQAQTRLSENLVRATLSTLFRIGVIDVRVDGKSKNQSPNWFKVNETVMLKWEKYSIEDCIKNPDYAISTDQYRTTGWKPSYLDKSPIAAPQSQQYFFKNEDYIDNATNEENIPNVDNILSAGAHERISTKPREFHSPAMAEYKKEEDTIMERLQKATSWLDFDKITRDVDKILINPPSEKVKECTYQRLQALTASKIPYFTKKYQSEPDNPIGRQFFKWLDIWGKLHGDAT